MDGAGDSLELDRADLPERHIGRGGCVDDILADDDPRGSTGMEARPAVLIRGDVVDSE
jgi:hypothetical protein